MRVKAVLFSAVVSILVGLASYGQDKPAVAIMDLHALGVSQSEAISVTNLIRNELFATGQYKVVEREKMEEIAKEVGFQLSGCTSSECVVEAGRIFGVQRMVAGSLDKLGSLYVINLRMIEVETGEIVSVARADCMGSIEEVAVRSTREVVRKLTGKTPSAMDTEITISPGSSSGGIKNLYLPGRAMALTKKKFFVEFDVSSDRDYGPAGGYTVKYRAQITYGFSRKISLFLQPTELRFNNEYHELGLGGSGNDDHIFKINYALRPWSEINYGVNLSWGICAHGKDIMYYNYGWEEGYYIGLGGDGSTALLFGLCSASKWYNNLRLGINCEYSAVVDKPHETNVKDAWEIEPGLDFRLSNRVMLIMKLYRHRQSGGSGYIYTIKRVKYEALYMFSSKIYVQTGLVLFSEDFLPENLENSEQIYLNLGIKL